MVRQRGLGSSLGLTSLNLSLHALPHSLQRIHNSLIKQYFTTFNAKGHFVPNGVLSYVYPMDQYSECSVPIDGKKRDDEQTHERNNDDSTTYSLELMQSCHAVTTGVGEICRQLTTAIGDNYMMMEDDNTTLLLTLMAEVDIVKSRALVEDGSPVSLRAAIAALRLLYHFHVKVNALTWSRKVHQKHKSRIKFSLGQVVKHKQYDYRGVVVAWDPRPYVDVSNWDGLQNVENPQLQPFYHVRPDANDCIQAFGGPRHFRYVCEENLELIDGEELELELESQEWKWDGDSKSYLPSEEKKVSVSILICDDPFMRSFI